MLLREKEEATAGQRKKNNGRKGKRMWCDWVESWNTCYGDKAKSITAGIYNRDVTMDWITAWLLKLSSYRVKQNELNRNGDIKADIIHYTILESTYWYLNSYKKKTFVTIILNGYINIVVYWTDSDIRYYIKAQHEKICIKLWHCFCIMMSVES